MSTVLKERNLGVLSTFLDEYYKTWEIVYIVWLGKGAYYKIGMTTATINKRLSEFRTSNPWVKPVAIVHTRHALEVELLIHKILKDEGLHADFEGATEIFELSDERLDALIHALGTHFVVRDFR